MAKANFSGHPAKITVIGLGGGGGNAVNRMVREGIKGVEFITMNTDAQSLSLSEAPVRIRLGRQLTKGLGTGGDHILGRMAAEESRDTIARVISGADLVFVTCGMGGGTGTGAASCITEIARNCGALAVAVVNMPFTFEGKHRCELAESGIFSLTGKVDALIIIPNDRLLVHSNQKVNIDDAFHIADDMLKQSIQAVTDVINNPGIINLDLADIRAVMRDAGPAWMSVGTGSGLDRAVQSARAALASPLLDVSVRGATRVLFNVVSKDRLTLFEVHEAGELIKQAVAPEANIIFGVARDPNMPAKELKITLIATGFPDKNDIASRQCDATLQIPDA